jgi:hypothetical protein
MEGGGVEPTAEFTQLQRHVVNDTPWRYEVIRPLVLLADRTATQWAQETHTHPETVRALTPIKRVTAISTGALTGAGWTLPWMGSTGGV